MSDKSNIEWTDATWGVVTGCTKVSQGCKNCYAEREWPRLQHTPRFAGRAFTDVACHADRLDQPLRWRKPRRIFVNSMSDLFHESVPFEFVSAVFAVMGAAKHHVFQILTKRPQRMLEFFQITQNETHGCNDYIDVWADCLRDLQPDTLNRLPLACIDAPDILPNVWLGVSVEDQQTADERIPLLLQTPAAVRWISAEPLLGPIKFGPYTLTENPCFVCKIEDDLGEERGTNSHPINCKWRHDVLKSGRGIDWIVAGGESGPKARPSHPDWFRSLRDQCVAAGVPFFFKQWGEWCPATADFHVHGSVMPETGEKFTWIGWDGKTQNPSAHGLMDPVMAIARLGKKHNGNLLDGEKWEQYPAELHPGSNQ